MSCQHLQVLVANLLEKHWEWKEERSRDSTNNVHGKLGHQNSFWTRRGRGVLRKIWSHDIHGCMIAALICEMSGLEGESMFECVENSFNFNRCAKEPAVANDGCATTFFREGKLETEKHGPLVGPHKRESASDMQLCVGRELLDYVPLQKMEQMPRDLIENADKWDLPLNLHVCGRQERMKKKKDLMSCCHQWTDVQAEIQDFGMCDEQATEDS